MTLAEGLVLESCMWCVHMCSRGQRRGKCISDGNFAGTQRFSPAASLPVVIPDSSKRVKYAQASPPRTRGGDSNRDGANPGSGADSRGARC